MDWYEPEVRALESARRLRRPMDGAVIFYGSSTIRLWKDLSIDLKCPEILNLGFGGSTLEACAYFFERLIVPEKPASLVLYAGDNDLGDGREPEQVAGYFREFGEKFKSAYGALPFGVISIKPSPARFVLLNRIRLANSLIQQQTAELKGAYFIDLFEAMLRADQTPRAELFEEDGLHMNRAGYQLWTKLLWPYRNRMFTPVSSRIQSQTVSSQEE